MLQRISWPTAIVLVVALVVGGFLTWKGVAIPAWVLPLVFSTGAAMPQVLIGKGGQL